jgi:hypothetical protein
MEAKRRALDEIAARQRTADEKRKEEGQQKQVPSSSEQLSAATPSWDDGPHEVTAIRNSVTHSYESSDSPPVFEAWQLAQWYLELILLRLFAFNGSYSNRTKQGKYIGQVEPVPWVG